MKIALSACLLFWGYMLLDGLADAQDTPTSRPVALDEPSVHSGYEQVFSDLQHHFWDPNYKIPRIRPTRGGNSAATPLDVGTIDNNAPYPRFWQMAQYANIQYWNWKITHSAAMKAQIKSQWRYIRSVFSDKAITSPGSLGIISVSDDAAWELNYLIQVHEVTGDAHALALAQELLPSILNCFADPNTPRVHYGSLMGSPYGILYATAKGDPGLQGRSSSYEIMIADSALEMYQQTRNSDYLDYAIGTYNWTQKYLKDPSRGYYYCMLDLRPTINGSKNPHYLTPVGETHSPPVRGHSASYSGGTMAMAVAAARLYKITGDQKYLAEAQAITSDYVRRDVFLRPGNLLVNERDAWTDGHWGPYFADEVLPLPGVDSTGLWKTAIRSTALSIIAQRTPDGFYGADWSGPEHGLWIQQAGHGNGSAGGMAVPDQIMTSSDSAAMVTAAEVVEARSHHK